MDQKKNAETKLLPSRLFSLAHCFAPCALFSLLVRFFRSPTLTESLAKATQRLNYSYIFFPVKFAGSVR